uniref:BED-type domain-containing protein n=1 Tax=Steinernema glaseri TaxID=37863 RepID=A0A1I7Y919_9BILA
MEPLTKTELFATPERTNFRHFRLHAGSRSICGSGSGGVTPTASCATLGGLSSARSSASEFRIRIDFESSYNETRVVALPYAMSSFQGLFQAVMSQHYRSKYDQFFKVVGDYHECRICGKTVKKQNDSGTNNMRHHLKLDHREEFEEFDRQQKERKERRYAMRGGSQQANLASTFKRYAEIDTEAQSSKLLKQGLHRGCVLVFGSPNNSIVCRMACTHPYSVAYTTPKTHSYSAEYGMANIDSHLAEYPKA